MFDAEAVLDFEFEDGDLGTISIKDYLKELLVALLRDGESFSGKRPFGNSGWEYSLAAALIKAKAIDGSLDEEGYAEGFAWPDYHSAMQALVLAL